MGLWPTASAPSSITALPDDSGPSPDLEAAPAFRDRRADAVRYDVELAVRHSDNDIAEGLLRLTTFGQGRAATFAGGAAAVHAVLVQYGIPLTGVKEYDGSGLSRSDRRAELQGDGLHRLPAVPGLRAKFQHPELDLPCSLSIHGDIDRQPPFRGIQCSPGRRGLRAGGAFSPPARPGQGQGQGQRLRWDLHYPPAGPESDQPRA